MELAQHCRNVLILPAEMVCEVAPQEGTNQVAHLVMYLTCPQFLDVGREGMGNR